MINLIDESKIFLINIAVMSNVSLSNEEYYNTDDYCSKNYTMELEDSIVTFDKFSQLCYPNNYSFFELNDQYKRNTDFLLNKNIKQNSFSNLNKQNLKLSIIDVMREKYITKNKTKIPSYKYINFIKDVNNYASLLDFKYYKQKLNLEDVYILFQQQYKKEQKEYFRFTIAVNYYSNDLEENIEVIYPFLVKIPNNFKIENYNVEIEIPEEILQEEVKMNHEPEVQYKEDEKIIENIVYSNYINNNDNMNNDETTVSSSEFIDDNNSEFDYGVDNLISNITKSNINNRFEL